MSYPRAGHLPRLPLGPHGKLLGDSGHQPSTFPRYSCCTTTPSINVTFRAQRLLHQNVSHAFAVTQSKNGVIVYIQLKTKLASCYTAPGKDRQRCACDTDLACTGTLPSIGRWTKHLAWSWYAASLPVGVKAGLSASYSYRSVHPHLQRSILPV